VPSSVQFFKSVVPLFAYDGNIQGFLGTAVFVGDLPLLATADHVVRNWEGDFAFTLPPSPILWNVNAFKAHLVARDPEFDLALLDASPFRPEYSVMPADNGQIANNIPVLCYEYGTTQTIAGVAHLAPAMRMGNVTRVIDLSDRFGRAGESALELSFPALRGASGAPVISSQGFYLWGIVIANIEYHLLPAQIISVLDETNQVYEETKYMLPQAVAVNVKHLRPMLEGHL
jgi:hypothetical protein